MATTTIDRIREHVRVDASGCWLWTGSVDHRGYGVARIGSRTDGTRRLVRAHRLAYEAHTGQIPAGLVIDHTCRVRRCCNPLHLEPVTHRTNVLRGAGPTATEARQTHCVHGHELAGANVYAWRGHRYCVTCRRARDARRTAAGAT